MTTITSRICIILFGLLGIASAYGAENYAGRKDVQSFIDQMVKEDGFDRAALAQVFSSARRKQKILDAISRPAEKVLKWNDYQDIFLTAKRVKDGKKFLMQNKQALLAAREKYGVPPVIVAAIIGVETMYGQRSGNYRVIDALSTLAFDYPPRSGFFRSELRQFLLLTREEKKSPLEPLGSYAGAMGYGQFIPSSFREYAVDFDGDGARDIWKDRTDAIGSVANYLARHGWRAGERVTLRVETPGASAKPIFTDELKPSRTMGELKAAGVVSKAALDDSVRVAPLVFYGKQGNEFWLGLHNFYVITRYNHSKLYAMAVYQLSERLKNQEYARQR